MMIRTGIIGGSGYVAGELIRLLLQHESVSIDFIYSHSNSTKKVFDVHDDLYTHPELEFCSEVILDVDVVFLCLGHGNSIDFLEKHSFSPATKVVDLSNDFRLKSKAEFKGETFIYGLPEANRIDIQQAKYIANPGCFATAIELALLPLAQEGVLRNEVHLHAITGSTGAGKGFSDTSHFSWRNNNVSVYKAFRHQHLAEIQETLISKGSAEVEVNFIPMRGNFTRGIYASSYTKCDLREEELVDLFTEYYKSSPFTFVSKKDIHLKQVVNSNNALIQVQKIEGKVLVNSVIDNLLKGAAGQAVQNMNLLFGFEEDLGLYLKPSYF